MNTKCLLSTLMMFVITASLLLAACAPAAPATPAKDMSDPVTVVQTFYELFNAKDLDKAMSLTAEDYVMNDPFGTYDRAAAATQWQAVMDAGISFNQTNFVDTGNGRVTSCYEVLENGKSVDKGCGNVTHVRDGKIIYDGLENAEQIWVVQKYEALNAKNLDLAMSFIAGDALFINPTGTYEGADAIRESLTGLNTDGITFDLSNFRNTGGMIVYDYKVMQGSNLLDQGTNGLTVVKDGLVTFDGTEDTLPAR
jgi:ketosteroid isomerase-like protein